MTALDASSEDTSRWEAAYASGEFREHWDTLDPSPDLVGFIAAGTVPGGGTVLDLGCGAGTNAVFLAGLGYRAIGVDLSPTALEIAAGRADEAGVDVNWRQGSVLSLPLDKATVDFAFDRGCLHHIAPADWPTYAAEVRRVLKPRGQLLVHGGRNAGEAATYPIDGDAIRSAFAAQGFTPGPGMPFRSWSDSGSIAANLVLLRRE